MRKKLGTFALAGALGVTAVAGAALVVPAVSYAATGDSTALQGRVTSIKDALKGLVSDGTLTQSQADEVASTLAEARPEGLGHRGPGGRGPALEALASLGITADEVRAAADAGKTLGELAAEQGVSEEKVVSTLVAAAKERLAAGVADGRLTQAEADEKAADLQARITEDLDEPIRHRGHGPHGGRHGGPDGDGERAPASPPPAESPDA